MIFRADDSGADRVIDFPLDLAPEYRTSFPEDVLLFTFERPGFVV